MKKLATILLTIGLATCLTSESLAAGNKAAADVDWFVDYLDIVNPTLAEVDQVLAWFPSIAANVDIIDGTYFPSKGASTTQFFVTNLTGYNDTNGNPVWYYETYLVVHYGDWDFVEVYTDY